MRFPLLLIPLAICNIIIFLMPGVALDTTLGTLPLVSGASWTVTLHDALVTLGVGLMLLEVVNTARYGAKYLLDHLLSFLVFAGAAAEFLMLPPFAKSTVFILTVMAFADFAAGVALRRRRRTVAVVERPIETPAEPARPAAPAETRAPAPDAAPYSELKAPDAPTPAASVAANDAGPRGVV